MLDAQKNPKILTVQSLEFTMLRKIISLYKAVFLITCSLMLAGALILGFFAIVGGHTPSQRWEGVGLMHGGSLFVLALAGNFALVLQNNELLRRIAKEGEKANQPGPSEGSKRLKQRAEPIFQRKEPTH
jgi:hypothetical protein